MQKIISKIQERVIKLLSITGKTLKETCFDNCSEVSRLVAKWLFDENKNIKIEILKGDNVFNTDKSHDILAVFDLSKVLIIDPTIWQFTEDAKNILILELNENSDYLQEVQKVYGGYWNVSETLTPESYTEEQLIKTISINLSLS